MWLDSKAVNCPQKWGNFKVTSRSSLIATAVPRPISNVNVPESKSTLGSTTGKIAVAGSDIEVIPFSWPPPAR